MKDTIGKEVKWVGACGSKYDGIVVGATETEGYTIVSADAPELFLTCVRGPGSPKFFDDEGEREIWEARKAYFLGAVAAGLYEVKECDKCDNEVLSGIFSSPPSTATCAFS